MVVETSARRNRLGCNNIIVQGVEVYGVVTFGWRNIAEDTRISWQPLEFEDIYFSSIEKRLVFLGRSALGPLSEAEDERNENILVWYCSILTWV